MQGSSKPQTAGSSPVANTKKRKYFIMFTYINLIIFACIAQMDRTLVYEARGPYKRMFLLKIFCEKVT